MNGARMRRLGRMGLAFAIVLLVAMSVSTIQASAMNWYEGDFWKYSVTMGAGGISVQGNITYSFEETRSVTIGGASLDTNVLSISGSLEGSDSVVGIPYGLSISLGGYLYLLKDGMASLESDRMMWTEVAIGFPGFEFTFETDTETITTYSPPLMQEFDPSDSSPGDLWIEGVDVTENSWTNGTMVGSTTYHMAYDFAISSETEELTTDAGTFETMRITQTDEEGNAVVYWWSSEVGNYVQEYDYESGNAEPVLVMTLSDYESGDDVEILLFAAIGGIVLAVAVVILAIVMLSRRKPGQPSADEPGTPESPPISQRKSQEKQ